jgi:hypothetical protein
MFCEPNSPFAVYNIFHQFSSFKSSKWLKLSLNELSCLSFEFLLSEAFRYSGFFFGFAFKSMYDFEQKQQFRQAFFRQLLIE